MYASVGSYIIQAWRICATAIGWIADLCEASHHARQDLGYSYRFWLAENGLLSM
jgi:hypothetical protein